MTHARAACFVSIARLVLHDGQPVSAGVEHRKAFPFVDRQESDTLARREPTYRILMCHSQSWVGDARKDRSSTGAWLINGRSLRDHPMNE